MEPRGCCVGLTPDLVCGTFLCAYPLVWISEELKRPQNLLSSGDEKNNKHKQILGIVREWVGVKFVYVLPFSWAHRETHITKTTGNLTKMPGQSPGQSRDNPGTIP